MKVYGIGKLNGRWKIKLNFDSNQKSIKMKLRQSDQAARQQYDNLFSVVFQNSPLLKTDGSNKSWSPVVFSLRIWVAGLKRHQWRVRNNPNTLCNMLESGGTLNTREMPKRTTLTTHRKSLPPAAQNLERVNNSINSGNSSQLRKWETHQQKWLKPSQPPKFHLNKNEQAVFKSTENPKCVIRYTPVQFTSNSSAKI
jgi:hypothetical protein